MKTLVRSIRDALAGVNRCALAECRQIIPDINAPEVVVTGGMAHCSMEHFNRALQASNVR